MTRQHGKSPHDADGASQETDPKPRPPCVILVRPQLGENIGMVARAMANFSLLDMRIVAPRDGWPNSDAFASAAGATGILNNARVYESVRDAVGDLHFVCGTTARARDSIKTVSSPRTFAAQLLERDGAGERCGILFGPENSGLDNDDLSYADVLVMAPVNPDFASLNLAQAVLIVAYEWYNLVCEKSLGRRPVIDGPGQEGLYMGRTRPATREELAGFFEHLEGALDETNFLRPPEKRPQMVRNIRNMFMRMGASEQEVRTLRGIVSSLTLKHLRKNKVP